MQMFPCHRDKIRRCLGDSLAFSLKIYLQQEIVFWSWILMAELSYSNIFVASKTVVGESIIWKDRF